MHGGRGVAPQPPVHLTLRYTRCNVIVIPTSRGGELRLLYFSYNGCNIKMANDIKLGTNLTTIVQNERLTNSEAMRKKNDEIIIDLAKSAGEGDKAMVDFFDKMSVAYVDGNLNHVTPKARKAGSKAAAVDVQHYAQHAYDLWDRHYTKAVMSVASKTTRVSELTTVFNAAFHGRKDIVQAAIKAELELKADMLKKHNENKANKEYSGKTIGAILKAARAQTAKAKENKIESERALSDIEVRASLLPKQGEDRTEHDDMQAILKSLGKMKDTYVDNAAVYAKAIENLTAVAKLLARRADQVKAQRDIEAAQAKLAELSSEAA